MYETPVSVQSSIDVRVNKSLLNAIIIDNSLNPVVLTDENMNNVSINSHQNLNINSNTIILSISTDSLDTELDDV